MANGWDLISPQNLFSTQEDRDSESIGKLKELYVSSLVPFQNHTFKVKDDAKMEELMQSISENGVLEPVMAFVNEAGEYELIAGHRRIRACELLGIETISVLIKNVTRDEATIIMGESNLQSRDEILPSEKGFTYKAMYEAMKRQGRRTDLTSGPLDPKLEGRSDERLAAKSQDSSRQILRYIRLTFLIPNLLDLVDEKRIGMRSAVELSYLPESLQECIYRIYREEEITPSHAQARKMRQLLTENLLDEAKISEIMSEVKSNQRDTVKLSENVMNRFFTGYKTTAEIENRIIRALELLEKQEKIQGINQDSFTGLSL